MPLNFHASTNKGDNREYNEDYIDGFEHNQTLFLLVADGQGSTAGGQSASAVAINEVKAYILQNYEKGGEKGLEELLRKAYYVAHRVIEGVRKGDPGRYNGLSTSLTVLALTNKKQITFSHVGNTKFFLYRGGNLIQMTKDQTVAQQLLDEKKITREEVLQHPERMILTNGLGVFTAPVVDIKSGAVQNGDILLLLSDGITEHLQQPEIVTLMNSAGNVKTTVDYLIQGANERGGYDNLSAICSYIDF